jgi:hypothetical protein
MCSSGSSLQKEVRLVTRVVLVVDVDRTIAAVNTIALHRGTVALF